MLWVSGANLFCESKTVRRSSRAHIAVGLRSREHEQGCGYRQGRSQNWRAQRTLPPILYLTTHTGGWYFLLWVSGANLFCESKTVRRSSRARIAVGLRSREHEQCCGYRQGRSQNWRAQRTLPPILYSTTHTGSWYFLLWVSGAIPLFKFIFFN